VGKPLTVPLIATNDARVPLSYSIVKGPAGARLDPTTGVFSWTAPTTAPSSPVSVTVRVAVVGNASLSSSETFTIVVAPRPTVHPAATAVVATSGTPFALAGSVAGAPGAKLT